jgi:hypothetical protein
MGRLCGDGARWAQARIPNAEFPRGLANRVEATQGREAVRDVRGDRRIHFDFALL